MSEYETLDYGAPNEPSSLLVLTKDSDYFSPTTTDLPFPPSIIVHHPER